MLTIEPLIDALAAGNTAILKPSAYSAHTTALISRMIQECFDENMWPLSQVGARKIISC